MPQAPRKQHVDAVRSFNRFYTRRIGALEEGYLASGFTLAQARVLYELAQRESTTATQIRESLGLDAGYLSRILAAFARRRIISRKRTSTDSRQIAVSLTATGRKAFAALDRRSHASTEQMLAELQSGDRDRLLMSLDEVQRAFAGAPRKEQPLVLRQPRPGDVGWAIERHGTLYAQEFGWNLAFEALVATLFASFATRHDPARERMWVAEIAGERVGCVFIVSNSEDRDAAQLRCLLVDPKARGRGVGARLVQECIEFSRAAGYRRMVLWTNDVLVSARKIYEAAGFRLVESRTHRDFGPELVGQTWAREL